MPKIYKNPLDQANAQQPQKPLHIRSLEQQVAQNPKYDKIARSVAKDDDVYDAYFYGLKDAFEKHGYNPSDDDITSELQDQYYRLADSYRDRWGYDDHDWDWYGVPRFEEQYGNESNFIKVLMDALRKERGDY